MTTVSLSTTTGRARTTRPRVSFHVPSELVEHRETMWGLHAQAFHCDEKLWRHMFDRTQVYAVYWVQGEIVGFSSVMEAELQVGDRRVLTIGLGQTVVHPDYRNQFLVQRALIFRWIRHFLRRPWRPIYIWGSCMSYKSYLSFVKVLREVYPKASAVTPPQHAAVLNAIGQHWYEAVYDPLQQVVIQPNFRVFDPYSHPQAKDLEDPDIAYYHGRVPQLEGATAGLLTISPCTRSNFLPMVGGWVRNVIRKSLGMRKARR